MHIIIALCMGILCLCCLFLVALLARSGDRATRAVVGDGVFYLMLCIYLGLTIFIPSSIAMDIALLGSLLGILSTIAMARILSKGRR